ncbi:MAG: hypothetical protein AAF191_11855, partial [Verrucomicrobiota bacterium]
MKIPTVDPARSLHLLLMAFLFTGWGSAEERKSSSKKREEPPLVAPSRSLDAILSEVELETIYQTSFDEPLKMLPITELLDERGKQIATEPPEDIDWILEGPADISVKDGRMHMRNDP